ncbi:MAG: hypothetical protein WBA57_11880 [Elainellaceae cyanobacterium]
MNRLYTGAKGVLPLFCICFVWRFVWRSPYPSGTVPLTQVLHLLHRHVSEKC